MLKPRTAVVLVIIAALSICTCLSISGACIDALAQQSQGAASDNAAQQGIKLYEPRLNSCQQRRMAALFHSSFKSNTILTFTEWQLMNFQGLAANKSLLKSY
jgi:hypothetical protein